MRCAFMKTHTFTLILSGVAEITPELADALYAATRGDIEFNMRDGVAFVEVERTATTLREAISTAIREVEQADVGVRVVRVESEAANVIAKINADLLGVTSG
jgi:Ser-tRNA(Ala) deacylase AlaX